MLAKLLAVFGLQTVMPLTKHVWTSTLLFLLLILESGTVQSLRKQWSVMCYILRNRYYFIFDTLLILLAQQKFLNPENIFYCHITWYPFFLINPTTQSRRLFMPDRWYRWLVGHVICWYLKNSMTFSLCIPERSFRTSENTVIFSHGWKNHLWYNLTRNIQSR